MKWTSRVELRAGCALVACVVAAAISSSPALAVNIVPPACPQSSFRYSFEFRLPVAPEGFADDCSVRFGVATVYARSGAAQMEADLPGSLAVDPHGGLIRLSPGPTFDLVAPMGPVSSVTRGGVTTTLAYNSRGRVRKITNSSSTQTLSYDAAGRLIRIQFTPSTWDALTYDPHGHLAEVTDSGGDVGRFTYTAGGHLANLGETFTAMDPSESFTYGVGGALTSWTESSPSAITRTFTTDRSGDVTLVKRGSSTDAALTYLGPHRPSTVIDGVGNTIASFTYGGGQLIKAAGVGGQFFSFTYGGGHRLTSVTDNNGASTTFAYDARGRLTTIGASSNPIQIAYVPAPAAVTRGVIAIRRHIATLTGMVNPHGLPATFQFVLGKTQAYGRVTALRSAGSSSRPVSVSLTISGLAPRTTYHYRLVARSPAGTTLGADHTFRTRR